MHVVLVYLQAFVSSRRLILVARLLLTFLRFQIAKLHVVEVQRFAGLDPKMRSLMENSFVHAELSAVCHQRTFNESKYANRIVGMSNT